MMAGLSIIPLLVSGGAAIDYERGVNAGTILQASLDSSAFCAVALPDPTNAALTSKAQIYIQKNYEIMAMPRCQTLLLPITVLQ